MRHSPKLVAALAGVTLLLGYVTTADAQSRRARFRSCRPSVGFDIKVSGASCRLARRVVADSFVKETLIPGTHGLGFIVDRFRCRVTQLGVENKPIPARYRCRRANVILTWAYHP